MCIYGYLIASPFRVAVVVVVVVATAGSTLALATTLGVSSRAGNVAKEDAAIVRLLREAGAGGFGEGGVVAAGGAGEVGQRLAEFAGDAGEFAVVDGRAEVDGDAAGEGDDAAAGHGLKCSFDAGGDDGQAEAFGEEGGAAFERAELAGGGAGAFGEEDETAVAGGEEAFATGEGFLDGGGAAGG